MTEVDFNIPETEKEYEAMVWGMVNFDLLQNDADWNIASRRTVFNKASFSLKETIQPWKVLEREVVQS